MSRWARTLTLESLLPKLDLLPYVGQRTSTYRFDLVDINTGYRREVHPFLDSVPTLSHDVGRTITRRLDNFILDADESALVDVITSRIEPFMVLDGEDFPLGRYMYNREIHIKISEGVTHSSSITDARHHDLNHRHGEISSGSLYDESFIVDQRISESFSQRATIVGGLVNAVAPRVQLVILALLADLPITVDIEATPFFTDSGWPAGTSRGFMVEQLATDGDYFSPWFGNDSKMHFIRSFDPATAIATFDLDSGSRVIQEKISRTNDLIDAPNTFVVISNGAEAQSSEIIGRYDVPSSAPHSIANRGFIIPFVENRQVNTIEQAKAVATNIGQRATIFERIELYTVPDPRHDGYDVLRWQGDNWLELAWSLPLIEGAAMQHVARKAYPT